MYIFQGSGAAPTTNDFERSKFQKNGEVGVPFASQEATALLFVASHASLDTRLGCSRFKNVGNFLFFYVPPCSILCFCTSAHGLDSARTSLEGPHVPSEDVSAWLARKKLAKLTENATLNSGICG